MTRPGARLLWIPPAAVALAAAWVLARPTQSDRRPAPSSPAPATTRPVAATSGGTPVVSRTRVEAFCGACHAYPPPDTFPRANWPAEVRRGFDFARRARRPADAPPLDGVVAYYQSHAPEAFVLAPVPESGRPAPVAFRRREVAGPRAGELPAISFVGPFAPANGGRPELLACDMALGELRTLRDPTGGDPMAVLADGLAHPAHVEAADLDADGLRDLLVADLGIPVPSDAPFGRVLWLRGRPDGDYETQVLASGLGRVSDVQAADFDGDGDLDLVVAVFGWHDAGEILYLEQTPGAEGRPEFARRRLDDRHGAIHVPVVDLDADGRPDFVALIAQEHEAVVAFLNRGEGRFETRTLDAAPHPAFGSSGIQVVDLDGDGDRDVLRTNGDVYDSPLLKPYHGVSWLENRGPGPFAPHPIGPLYGAHRAVAGDLDGDGDLDIIATSFLGEPYYADQRRAASADAVVLFEQLAPGEFARHVLEREACDYPACALSDLDGDGDLDVVLGRFLNFGFAGLARPASSPATGDGPLVILENLGPPAGSPPSGE
jgi:hypothetical protein